MNRNWFVAALLTLLPLGATAQSEIYPEHFDLEQVTLLDGPLKTAMQINDELLLRYDVDRLLTPFVRQAGLNKGKYAGWASKHPSFSNWGLSDWSLEGHVGGHYLTALALAYAATDDASMKTRMKERLDYALGILKDCQDAYDDNTEGLYGFLGGQPINQIWTGLYKGDLEPFKKYGGWVPFYCEHKTLAGLRDAWLYTDSEIARDLFHKMCDWCVLVVSKLTDSQMQDILGWEHGGMNEPLADAYRLFGDARYLAAAKKYSHQWMINEMQTLNTTFLDGKHANTQVPKYVGFERIYQETQRDGKGIMRTYHKAAQNFWTDVAQNRTVCIGGNSVSEHFLRASNGASYIENLDGPESCNTNNMLKLTEDLFDSSHDAKYVDFYEQAMWNHILSTQDPTTGGYVYFTTLRPQAYRIYSQVNQGMWCCVGTGMENHSKYGHFIYTHSAPSSSTEAPTLYVNLFAASSLNSADFALTQQTRFPFEPKATLTIDRAGAFNLAVRHPAWTTDGFVISVNGTPADLSTSNIEPGKASYVAIYREWKKGDVVEISLPMCMRYEPCPNYKDYIAFKYGPILLAAQTTAASEEEAQATGLSYVRLEHEYAGEGRMDHAPGARTHGLDLSSAPLLIGDRASVLERITPTSEPLHFTLAVDRGKWKTLPLVPFYSIHHARYSCYFYQQTEAEYLKSDMARHDLEMAQLEARTLDFVGTGEQQSEAGHLGKYSDDSNKGSYNGEFYRDAQSGGWFEYTLETGGQVDSLAIMLRFTTADKGRVGTAYIDDHKLCEITIPEKHSCAEDNGFYNEEYRIPNEWLLNADGTARKQIVFRFKATGRTPIPGLYYVRLLKSYGKDAYVWNCQDWTTGDAGRVAANKITRSATANTLRVAAGTGQNNVCLMMTTEGRDYKVEAAQKFLIVKGQDISTKSGDSYLWWLNGQNRGSSVKPDYCRKADDGETIVAWDITKSGIDDNCKGGRWNFAYGQTIFGLTATKSPATITHIGFYTSVKDFLVATGVNAQEMDNELSKRQISGIYNLSGQQVASSSLTSRSSHGIYIVDGRKVRL